MCQAPKGLAIPFGVMKSAVGGMEFQVALKALDVALASSGDVAKAAQKLRSAVEKTSVPSEVLRDLAKGLAAERVAVRSSANSEDLEKVSGAGLHDSVLGVELKDPEKLRAAVLQADL